MDLGVLISKKFKKSKPCGQAIETASRGVSLKTSLVRNKAVIILLCRYITGHILDASLGLSLQSLFYVSMSLNTGAWSQTMTSVTFLPCSTFGELKTVRLPKKMAGTGAHRGFGFVDFVTKQDAKVRK